MNKFWLPFFFFFASILFPLDKKDLSKPICLNPEKTGSVEHSSGVGALLTLGLSLAGKFECAFYDNLSSSRDRKTASDCRELMCRAKNRSLIVERGKNIINLSEQAIKENKPGTSRTKLNRGIKKIENGIEQWNNVSTVSANANVADVNTRFLEKHLNIPLEKFINDQFSSLPKDLQSSYKTERKRIYEEELEKKRIAAEKKRKEQEEKRKKIMEQQAQIKKEAEIEKARQTTNLFFVFLGLGGVIVVALTLSHRRAMKELELSIASASGAKDSFFSDNNINLDSLSSETNDETGNVKSESDEKTQDEDISKSKSFFETNEIDIAKTPGEEDEKTNFIEVVNFEDDFDPDFDLETYLSENMSSFNWNTLRQGYLHYSITDSNQYPNKKACLFSPSIFANTLRLIDAVYKEIQKSPDDGEEYFGESKDVDAYLKISEEVKLLEGPYLDKKEEVTKLLDTDNELASLRQLKNEVQTKIDNLEDSSKDSDNKKLIDNLRKKNKAYDMKALTRIQQLKDQYREVEADVLIEVELIIYRSELAEEFKKKLISLLPEAVGVDY